MMTEVDIHTYLIYSIYAFGSITAILLLFISAPYGKFHRKGWGPSLDNRLGWCIMETPSFLVFLFVYSCGEFRWQQIPLLLLCLWQIHYIYRSFIFPFLIRTSQKKIPLIIVLLSSLFNILNSYVNARYISAFSQYATSSLLDLNLIFGIILFVVGFTLNIWSDFALINLRKPTEVDYKIPMAPPFNFLGVSCPNYLGELLEWFGWALASSSLGGWAFAFFTAANLIPRALKNHQWYKEKFDEYPLNRKAIIPFFI